MKCIGNRKKLCFEIGSFASDSNQLRTVDIWVANFRVTHFDNMAYLPAFITSMSYTSATLKRKVDYARYSERLQGFTVRDVHLNCVHDGEMYWFHRILDWGPTTDQCNCLLLVWGDELHLTCQDSTFDEDSNVDEEPYIVAFRTTPLELWTLIDHAIESLILDCKDAPWTETLLNCDS